MSHLLLLLAILTIGWIISLAVHPFRPCPRCTPHAARRGGAGRNPGSGKRRFGPCGKCDGTGRTRRFGAKAVHLSIERARKGVRNKQER